MAVTYDTSTVGGTWAGTSKSWVHTVAVQDDRLLIVCIATDTGYDYGNISSVTYGGVALTEAHESRLFSDGDQANLWVWYLVSPATGANWVVVSSINDEYIAMSMSYYGVHGALGGSPWTTTTQSNSYNSDYSLSLTQQTDGLIAGCATCTTGAGWHTHDANDTETADSTGLCMFYNDGAGAQTPNGKNNEEWPAVAWGAALWPPQAVAVDMSGVPASVSSSAKIGVIDDGNIALSMDAVTIGTMSASMGSILVSEPLEATMHIEL